MHITSSRYVTLTAELYFSLFQPKSPNFLLANISVFMLDKFIMDYVNWIGNHSHELHICVEQCTLNCTLCYSYGLWTSVATLTESLGNFFSVSDS